MTNFLKHLHTINKHRFLVMRLCFKLGLYWQGLTHDLSKYSLIEFFTSVKYFTGTKSPIDKEKKIKGYSDCWLHHKGRNKHHWQYWTDFQKGQVIYIEMPLKYIKEMLADRIAACMVYQKKDYRANSALNFYLNSQERILIPPETSNKLHYYLSLVAEKPLDEALHIIKNDR
ncbi:MAG: catalase [Erysipelotrichia bacterium]|nr:catalase [Erysipelotrichia bacterium]